MRHLEVLVVTEKEIDPRILNWKVSSVNNVETAIEYIQQRSYKVVAISQKLKSADKDKLSRILPIIDRQAILIGFTDASTVSERVKSAYWRNNKPNTQRNYLDNAFEIELSNTINSIK